MDSKKRLKFALVEEEILLGNSLNYIISNISEDFIFGLYSIFNSILLDWRFCTTSSNNHVNNYELDNLPLPKSTSDIIILEDLQYNTLADFNNDDINDVLDIIELVNLILD